MHPSTGCRVWRMPRVSRCSRSGRAWCVRRLQANN